MASDKPPCRKEPSKVAHHIPLLQVASQYQHGWLRPDLIAGLTVTALVVPKALGSAGIADFPIQHGQYAADDQVLHTSAPPAGSG